MEDRPQFFPRPARSELDDAGDEGVFASLESIADAIAGLANLLGDHLDIDPAMDRLCNDMVAAIADCDQAGVTLIREGHPVTAVRTDPVVDDVDRAQYSTQQGPSLDAALTRRIVRSDDDRTRVHYPLFAAANADSGIRSFLCAPLTIDGAHVGALALYSRSANGFDRVDAAALSVYITAAESTLTAAGHAFTARETVNGFARTVESRAAIEQCKGLMAAIMHISPDKAFDLLKWRSQETNVSVRALSEQMLLDVSAVDLVSDPVKDQLGKILMTAHSRVVGRPTEE